MEIYLDVLAVVNLLANYFILLAAAKVTRTAIRRFRFFLGALFGAAYAVAAVVVPFPFLRGVTLKLASGALMCLIAYGRGRAFPVRVLTVLAVSAAFAGGVLAVSLAAGRGAGFMYGTVAYLIVSLPVLVLGSALAYAGVTALFKLYARRKVDSLRKTVAAQAAHSGRTVTFSALVDTGCTLCDPMTNRPVLVASLSAVRPLLGERTAALLEIGADAADVVSSAASEGLAMRLVFYKTVSGGDMLPAFRPEKLTLDGRDRSGMLIAVTGAGLAGGDGVSAVVGATV